MLLTTKGSPSIPHTLKRIIQSEVSIGILVGGMREAHTTCQIAKATTTQTKAFQIKPLCSKIKVLKDFLQTLTKVSTPRLKGIQTHSLINLHKRSLENIVTQFVQTQQSTNTEFRTALNDVRSQITKLTSYMGNFQQEKGKLPSQTIQNPQGQNSVGISGPSDGTFEHCKAVTTLRSGKVIDKTIQPKELIQDFHNEQVGDAEMSDEPHAPRADVVDGEP